VGNRWHGIITSPTKTDPEALRVRIEGQMAEVVEARHRYRLRALGEGVVQPIAGTEATRFFAVAVAPDGTVWGGGDGGGRLYQIPLGSNTATLVGQLVRDPAGRVDDLVVDRLGRLHAVVFAPQESGVIMADQGSFCQTVNVFDPAYPFRVQDLQTGALQPSPSTRARAAGAGAIWLHGSDGGAAQVAGVFREGQCPVGRGGVRYEPVFRREGDGLLSNTVPALVEARDGSLWFGTAFGLTRFKDQRFTPVPFDPVLSFQGNVATLEAFFREVAQALFIA
jgi:hypothetical protein